MKISASLLLNVLRPDRNGTAGENITPQTIRNHQTTNHHTRNHQDGEREDEMKR